MDEVSVWLWQLINLPQCGSPVRRQNTHRYNHTHTRTHFWTFKNNEKHTVICSHLNIKNFRILPWMPWKREHFVPACWKGCRQSPWQQTDWWVGHFQGHSQVRSSCFSRRVCQKLRRQTGVKYVTLKKRGLEHTGLNYSLYCAKLTLLSLYQSWNRHRNQALTHA